MNFRAMVAEFIGTFAFVFIGILVSVVAFFILDDRTDFVPGALGMADRSNLLVSAFGHGLAIVTDIHSLL